MFRSKPLHMVPLHNKKAVYKQLSINKKEHPITRAAAHVEEDFSFSGRKDCLHPSYLDQEWRTGSYLEEKVERLQEPKVASKLCWVKPHTCAWGLTSRLAFPSVLVEET